MADKMDWKSAYAQKLRDPRWQKKRLEIMGRDEFTCRICFDSHSTLNVHHRYYIRGADPWEYPLDALVTLCEECHENESDGIFDAERTLIQAFKRRFFSGDIMRIAQALDQMPQLPHIPEVWATAIEHLFQTPEIQNDLLDKMFEHTSKMAAEKKKQREEEKARGEASHGMD